MPYDVIVNGTVAEVRLAGDLTFAHHGRFRALVDRLRSAVADHVTFDLSRVEYIDAAGLGLLLVVRDDVTGRGARSELKGARGQVGRLLEVARFDQLFQAA